MPGYDKPNYTQIPNVLLDEHLPLMGDAELRVVLVIARKTFGWHKDSDRISLSQLQELTGLSRQGVINGIDAAVNRGIVAKVEYAGKTSEYCLVVNQVDHTSQRSRLALVNEVDTQKKVVKEKSIEQEKQTNTDWIYEQYLLVFCEPVTTGESRGSTRSGRGA
jgi:phage replication O-like protein O